MQSFPLLYVSFHEFIPIVRKEGESIKPLAISHRTFQPGHPICSCNLKKREKGKCSVKSWFMNVKIHCSISCSQHLKLNHALWQNTEWLYNVATIHSFQYHSIPVSPLQYMVSWLHVVPSYFGFVNFSKFTENNSKQRNIHLFLLLFTQFSFIGLLSIVNTHAWWTHRSYTVRFIVLPKTLFDMD